MHPDKLFRRSKLCMDAVTIFVIDDHADNALMVAMLLRIYGWKARTFSNAQELVAEALIQPPACVVTDLNMPGTDGIALIEALRSNGLEVPVVVMTGATPGSPELRRARDLANAIVSKTHEATELEGAVRDAIASSHSTLPIPPETSAGQLPSNESLEDKEG